MKIKDLPLIEQPREKLLRYGPERLTEAELLAVILGSGQQGENALKLAGRVLKQVGKDKLGYAKIEHLMTKIGLGAAKACSIVAGFELAKRLLNGKKSHLLLSPKDVWLQLQDIRDQRKEHFIVFYLDVRNQIIKREVISIGTLTVSVVHPREVFEPAVRDGAAQILLAHNHPSNIVEPSAEDVTLTKRLGSCGQMLGIEVIDHIIVSKSAYFSFKEHNLGG